MASKLRRHPLALAKKSSASPIPMGMMLELIASPPTADVEPWNDSTVPAEHSLRGFHSVSAMLEGYERTAKLLTETFGYELIHEAGNRFRFALPGAEERAELSTCFVCRTADTGAAEQVRFITSRFAPKTMKSNERGARRLLLLVTTSLP
jgi:hypothetical protein